jgi:hypothetical protein
VKSQRLQHPGSSFSIMRSDTSFSMEQALEERNVGDGTRFLYRIGAVRAGREAHDNWLGSAGLQRLGKWLRTIGIVRRIYMLDRRPLTWLRTIRITRLTLSKTLDHRPHLFYPRRFTEMQWRKLFDFDAIYTVFCDKVATRDYVAQRVGPNAVVPILWLGHDPLALPLETLRPPYIIKCSHGSGFNITVRNNDVMDCAAIRAQFERWLAINYGDAMKEPGYCTVPVGC